MSIKGSRDRMQKGEKAKSDESPLWENIKKKKLNQEIFKQATEEQLKKHNVRILRDEFELEGEEEQGE